MPRNKLTTGECARILGVSTDYIRDEIRDGRIPDAIAFKRPSGRTFYRVPVDAFREYCQANGPAAVRAFEAWRAKVAA